tara:strand:- start:12769 stop:13536 length:768 start_codon:yes stop_codon:yes gene_type:complete
MTTETILTGDQVVNFDQNGYFIIREFFEECQVQKIRQEITKIVASYPDVSEELVQIEPAVRKGRIKPDNVELGVRKLFRMTLHNKLFHSLAFHSKMVKIATELLGPDVALFQSMLLMKPPKFGGRKVWHQDNAYFRLDPNHIFGFWIALDDADIDNGCMHLIPGSHVDGIQKHTGSSDEYGLSTLPQMKNVVPCVMKTGDALIFHGETYHYTPPNTTERRRRALQYHYGATYCQSSKGSPFKKIKPEIIVAGNRA